MKEFLEEFYCKEVDNPIIVVTYLDESDLTNDYTIITKTVSIQERSVYTTINEDTVPELNNLLDNKLNIVIENQLKKELNNLIERNIKEKIYSLGEENRIKGFNLFRRLLYKFFKYENKIKFNSNEIMNQIYSEIHKISKTSKSSEGFFIIVNNNIASKIENLQQFQSYKSNNFYKNMSNIGKLLDIEVFIDEELDKNNNQILIGKKTKAGYNGIYYFHLYTKLFHDGNIVSLIDRSTIYSTSNANINYRLIKFKKNK